MSKFVFPNQKISNTEKDYSKIIYLWDQGGISAADKIKGLTDAGYINYGQVDFYMKKAALKKLGIIK